METTYAGRPVEAVRGLVLDAKAPVPGCAGAASDEASVLAYVVCREDDADAESPDDAFPEGAVALPIDGDAPSSSAHQVLRPNERVVPPAWHGRENAISLLRGCGASVFVSCLGTFEDRDEATRAAQAVARAYREKHGHVPCAMVLGRTGFFDPVPFAPAPEAEAAPEAAPEAEAAPASKAVRGTSVDLSRRMPGPATPADSAFCVLAHVVGTEAVRPEVPGCWRGTPVASVMESGASVFAAVLGTFPTEEAARRGAETAKRAAVAKYGRLPYTLVVATTRTFVRVPEDLFELFANDVPVDVGDPDRAKVLRGCARPEDPGAASRGALAGGTTEGQVADTPSGP